MFLMFLKRARNHSDESEEENHAKKKSRRKGYKKRDKSVSSYFD